MRLVRTFTAAVALAGAACGPFHLGPRDLATVIFTNDSLEQADVYATIANADGLSFAGMALAAASLTPDRSSSSSRRFIRSISRPRVSPDFRRNRFVDQIR